MSGSGRHGSVTFDAHRHHMINHAVRFPLLLALALGCAAATPAPVPADSIPARALQCELRRATNLDPAANQTLDDIVYEGRFRLGLFLPVTARLPNGPPDPSEDPLPVDPALKIVNDDGGLLADSGPDFVRVVDIWPERVEMVRHMTAPYGKLLIISDISPDQRSARIYVTTAVDAASMDLDRTYLGDCIVTTL